MTTTSTIRWRVYRSPDGAAEEFCGEFDDRTKAEVFAGGDPTGTPDSEWESHRAAGGQAALRAPSRAGVEDAEPVGWYRSAGWHNVVRVEYAK